MCVYAFNAKWISSLMEEHVLLSMSEKNRSKIRFLD